MCNQDARPGAGLNSHPREFRLVGVLQRGLECNVKSFEALAGTEPRGLIVAAEDDKLEGKQADVLGVCKMLEETACDEKYRCVADMTYGKGVVVTFTKILKVSRKQWTREEKEEMK